MTQEEYKKPRQGYRILQSTSPIPTFLALLLTTLFALLFIMLMVLVESFNELNEKKNKIQHESNSEETTITNQGDGPGNFVILEKNTASITFNGFEGELVWYESYEGSHFYPIGFTAIENGKPIQVPEKARAFLKKGRATGEEYSMDASSHTR